MEKIKEHSIDLTSTIKIEEATNISEPETFDTWTIISDPLKNLKKIETDNLNNGNRIEILKDNAYNIPEIKHDPDYIDELSDGISIISDSESAGRSSPLMPLYNLIENNNNNNDDKENKEFEYKIKETDYEPIKISSPTTSTENCSTQNVLSNSNVDIIDNRIKRKSCCHELLQHDSTENLSNTKISTISATVKAFTTKNISIIFYLSASIAIIALIGKMKYPEWGNITLQEEIITQRVDDLELQNNLLRAEIDILSKQVNYLNKETQNNMKFVKSSNTIKNSNDNKNYVKKEKIKVWPGNGRIERTEIPKEALKMPYSCDQESDQEGICIESEFTNTADNNIHNHKDSNSNLDKNDIQDDIKNIIESIEKIVPVAETVLNDYETLEKIHVPENRHNPEINDKERYKKHEKYNRRNHDQHEQQLKHKNINQSNDKIPNNNIHDKSEKQYRNKKEKHDRDDIRDREPQRDQAEQANPKIRQKYNDDSSSEKYNKKNIKDFQDENIENNSNEKYYKKNKKYKENVDEFEKKSDNNYYKQKKHDKREKNNDDWHENMMKNREEYRKQHHDKWKTNNWYMDRASGREEARIFEKDQQHKYKKMKHQ